MGDEGERRIYHQSPERRGHERMEKMYKARPGTERWDNSHDGCVGGRGGRGARLIAYISSSLLILLPNNRRVGGKEGEKTALE